jgi:uncharacterized protein
MYYLDSSLIVASVTAEANGQRARDWLEHVAAHGLMTSYWTITEVASALAMKMRIGTLDAVSRANSQSHFQQMIATFIAQTDVARDDFSQAAVFAASSRCSLRAADALHLAIAGRHGATLATLDRAQAEAGLALGVQTLLV